MPMQQRTDEQWAEYYGYYRVMPTIFGQGGSAALKRSPTVDYATLQREAAAGGPKVYDTYAPGRALIGYRQVPGSGRYSGYARSMPVYSDLTIQAPAPEAPVIQEEVKKATAELTEEAKGYRTQAQEALSAAETIRAGLQDEEARQQRSYELQSKLAAEAFSRQEAATIAAEKRAAAAAEQGRREQATMIANRARGAQTAGMKIMPATGTPMTAGTQAFRRRPGYNLPIRTATATGINAPQSSTLNV